MLALRDDPPHVALPAAALDQYVGSYSLTPEVTYTIRRDGDGLVGQRTGRKPETLRPEVADYFFVPGQPRLRKVFQRDATGRIAGFVERRETWDIAWQADEVRAQVYRVGSGQIGSEPGLAAAIRRPWRQRCAAAPSPL